MIIENENLNDSIGKGYHPEHKLRGYEHQFKKEACFSCLQR